MPRALADTSAFIAVEQGRIAELPDDLELGLSIMTIGELHHGVYAAVARGDIAAVAQRTATLATAQLLQPIPVDGRIAARWGQLRAELTAAGHKMTVIDSWIAATALAEGLPVVTQDAGFNDVPGLTVIQV